MKLLAITNLYPNAVEPTRGTYNRQQFVELARHCSLTVVAPVVWSPSFLRRKASGIPVREVIDGIEVFHPRYFISPKIGRSLYGFFFFLSLHRFVKKLHSERSFDAMLATWAYPDVFGSCLIARLLKLPVTAKVHGTDINLYSGYLLRRKMISFALSRCSGVISVSRALGRRMVEIGVPQNRIHLLQNGIDASLFKPLSAEDCRKELGLTASPRTILFIGNLVPVKGIDNLIRAVQGLLRKNIDTRLVIVGNGHLRGELQALAGHDSDAGRISFAGGLPHDRIPVWMNACDILCLPSLNEGCPNVVVEAQACGLPVVATTVGGIPDIISSPEYGILVAPGDSKALGAALEAALNRTWNRSLISRNPFIKSWQENAQLLYQTIQQATNV